MHRFLIRRSLGQDTIKALEELVVDDGGKVIMHAPFGTIVDCRWETGIELELEQM
jgi:hypothetical protein